MSQTNQYDVIIIGSGAGGGTLAHRLAPSGKRILVIERGDFVPREKANWDPGAVFLEGRYNSGETWYDNKGHTFEPGNHYYVGGNTKFYGAALLRFRQEDFGEIRHVDGVSPAWPLSYSDFRPYYLEAEQLYHVHGERGADPTEPPEEAPYPHEPLPHEPRIQQLHEDFQAAGLNPFPLPIGLNAGKKDDPSVAPYILDNFDGFPDPTESKADAHVVALRPALQHSNVSLMRNAYVDKLTTDATGRQVNGVVVKHADSTETYSADVVVVACGAINSAALLLRSANDKHPTGLANSSDMVGRNYMFHNNSAFVAISKEVNLTRFGKTLAVNDYYFGSDDFEFPLGHIQMLGKSRKEMFQGDAPAFVPGLTLDVMANHALDFWMTTEDLPDPDNRITLREDGSIQVNYTENNVEAHKRLQEKLRAHLRDIKCDTHLIPNTVYLKKKIPIAGVAHQCGTVRFGNDPASSVLDVNCKAHVLDNLYVVDGSFFVSSTSVNPALTIIANALRVGDHLLDRLKG